MTREEFEQLLKANNIVFVGEAAWRVAQLVAAAEREACANVCDAVAKQMDDEGEGPTGYILWVKDCANAIRARGKE